MKFIKSIALYFSAEARIARHLRKAQELAGYANYTVAFGLLNDVAKVFEGIDNEPK